MAERLELAGSITPRLAREQDRAGLRREALTELAGVFNGLYEKLRCGYCGRYSGRRCAFDKRAVEIARRIPPPPAVLTDRL